MFISSRLCRVFILTALFLFMLTLSGSFNRGYATTAPITGVSVDGESVKNEETVSTNNNTVRIKVSFRSTATQIKIGVVATFTLDKADDDWKVTTTQPEVDAVISGRSAEVKYYPLKPGKNTITINGSGESKQTIKITVDYTDRPLDGAIYRILDITKTPKSDFFSKTVGLDFGKNNYLMDGRNKSKDQSVTVTLRDSIVPPKRYLLRSPVVRLESSDRYGTLADSAVLTLAFHPYTATGADSELTVFRITDHEDTNLGGKVSGNKIAVTLSGRIDGYYGVFAAVSGFRDFERLGWAYHSIYPLWVKGVMEPCNWKENPWRYPYDPSVGEDYFGLFLNRSYSRETNISRGEFAAMLVKGLRLKPVDPPYRSTFKEFDALDTDRRQLMETAVAHGVLRGNPDGTCPIMGVNGTLTRQQAAVLLARVAQLKLETDQKKVDDTLGSLFADAASIGAWAKPSVLACHQAGYISGVPAGDELHFKGGEHLTRIQGAALVHRLVVAKGNI